MAESIGSELRTALELDTACTVTTFRPSHQGESRNSVDVVRPDVVHVLLAVGATNGGRSSSASSCSGRSRSSGPSGCARDLSVGVLEFPLPPRTLHALARAVALHIRPAGVVDQGELQQCAEHEALANLEPTCSVSQQRWTKTFHVFFL